MNAVGKSRAVVPLACVLVAACSSSGQVGSDSPPERAAVEPMDMTYTLSCDGIVPDGLHATVVDGAARIPADGTRPPYYDHYDIRVTDTASGDLDGDGAADTVVLLQCSPQPSNGILQEVQVFSSAGSRLGTLPSPRTLQGDEAPLPPEYQPRGLSVRDGEIVATMQAYGPDDFHAGGPSLPLTVHWRFDGAVFEQVSS